MTTYNLLGNTSLGSSSQSNASPFLSGITFKVTSGGLYLAGYRYFVQDSAQPLTPQKFCLWQLIGGAALTSDDYLVPASTVTSGTLSVGWNFIPLAAPLALSANTEYEAATGFTGNFTYQVNQFGSGNPFSAGITSGPLSAFSDISGSAHDPFNNPQGLFDTSGADPAVRPPYQGSASANFGIDVQVTDQAPGGSSYRLWPSQPYPVNWANDTAFNFTLATEFILTQACTLNSIWFYTPPGTSQLPTACGIWVVGSQTLLPGSLNSSPSWSGAAGSGWVQVAYGSLALAAATKYKVSVFNGAASPVIWNAQTSPYWSGAGFGAGGIANGPVSAPNLAGATAPGQSSYHQGTSFAWPDTYAAGSAPNYWVDAEVTPSAPARTGLLMAGFP